MKKLSIILSLALMPVFAAYFEFGFNACVRGLWQCKQ